ncbi:MAG: xanthine dehydrogenase family protein, partial [Anaerolineales bacterium]|nr:xanthine dehydrogenase family protein [Anaerolineales bacterium]
MSAPNGEFKYIGHPRPIVDGLEKVTGYVKYTADTKLPGMLYTRLILSPYAHALIKAVDKSEAEALPGVVAVLTAVDLPTRDTPITSRNSAVLAKERVQWVGQPVAVVVAESEAIATDAAELVLIDYEPLTAVVRVREAILPDAPLVWPNGLPKEGDDLSSIHAQVEDTAVSDSDKPRNVSKENVYTRGDIEAGFAASDTIVEQTYHTSIVHQAYLEPHAVVVDPDPLGRGATIYTSTQGQHGVRDEVAQYLNLPQSAILVRPMAVGGGFGAKYGIYEPLATAVALTVRQPVRLVLTRSEDFLSTTPAPEILIKLKTGAKTDGTVTALQAQIYVNNGVFSFNHGGIMSLLMGGYYKFPHLKIEAYEVHTHTPPVGAYRAPGAPQATFAIESNMDDMAHNLGLDPIEFRLKNVVEGGDLMGNGRPWPEKIGLKQVLETLQQHPLWQNRQAGDGTGIAIGGWPTVVGTAEATCRVDTDGRVRINLGIVDVSGTKSSLVLVAAETLGVSPDDIEIVTGDTKSGPYTPNSGGSQITYSVAGAISNAAGEARRKLLEIAAEEFEAAVDDLDIVDGKAHVKGVPDKEIPIGDLVKVSRSRLGGLGPVTGEGTSAVPENAPGFVAHLVKVHVDPETAEITPLQYISVQDVGFAMNPMLVEGQMTGGSIQGLGMGLHERVVYDDSGQLLTGSFMDY